METHTGTGPGRKPNAIFAIVMIGAGVLLFLGNLGLLPIRHIWDYWPLIFVAIGLSKIGSNCPASGKVIGAVFVVLGLIFTLINVGALELHLNDGSLPLSLVFLALGFAGLTRALEGGRRSRSAAAVFTQFQNRAPEFLRTNAWDASPSLNNFAFMASINRKVDNLGVQSGALTTLFGSIEVDLRQATMPLGRNIIFLDVNAIMGSIKLRIPSSWRVVWNGAAIMANFEDKTVPPISGMAAPQLILTGYSVMATVEVES